MRDTLENLYFGNITPNDQIVKSGTALKKAMEQSEDDGSLIDPNKTGYKGMSREDF